MSCIRSQAILLIAALAWAPGASAEGQGDGGGAVEQVRAPTPSASTAESGAARDPLVRLGLRTGLGVPELGSIGGWLRVTPYAFEVEVGYSGFAFQEGFLVRAGFAPALLDLRARPPRGLTLHLPLMLGYQSFTKSGLHLFGAGNASRSHSGPEATANLAATYWFARHFGISAIAGGGILLDSTFASCADCSQPGTSDRRLEGIGRFSVGVSF